MPVAGPVVHQQLIQAYQEAQHELEVARGQVAAAGAQVNDLAKNRTDAMENLARHYLPELTGDAVQKTWAEVRHAISAVLKKKEDHIRRLTDQLSALGGRRESSEANLNTVNASLDAATESQGEISKLVSDELAGNSEFSTPSDRAAQAEASLQRAEANLAEIEQDVFRKLPAYENSALFTYLYERKFMTPDYQSRGMTKSIDQWLARYISFRDARQGYEFLKTTPVHMKEVIAEDRAALNTVLDELERQRDVVAIKHGLPAAIRRTQELTDRREAIVVDLDSIEAESKKVNDERSAIDDTRGMYYQQAIEKFRDLLTNVDQNTLHRRAQATPEMEDDQIVARLQGVDVAIDRSGEEYRQRQQQIEQMNAHLQAVGNLVSRFRAAGFDSARAQFSGTDDVVSMLRDAGNRGERCEEVWQQLRRGQRWGPSAIDQFTRVATHPLTQVLINAMAHAAAGALTESARQAGQRRSSSRPSGGTRNSGGGRPRGGGGFTTRDSF